MSCVCEKLLLVFACFHCVQKEHKQAETGFMLKQHVRVYACMQVQLMKKPLKQEDKYLTTPNLAILLQFELHHTVHSSPHQGMWAE